MANIQECLDHRFLLMTDSSCRA